MSRFIFFALAFLAILPDARAQFLWHEIHTDVIDDTLYSFRSVSCSGNNCTIGAIFIENVTHLPRLFFYRSTDAGKTWFWQDPHVSLPANNSFFNVGFNKIQQIDSLNIVGVGDSGVIIRTFDGGQTWERQYSPLKIRLSDVHFSDPMTGIITGGGSQQVIITSDGGRHWDFAPLQGVGFVQCHSYGNGKYRIFKYAFGPFYTTYDNFQTVDSTAMIFDSLTVPRWYAYILDKCTFGGGDTILTFGRYVQKDTLPLYSGYGIIMRTLDGGKHWEKPYIIPDVYLTQIDYTTLLNRDTVIAGGVSSHHILLSTDRGASWKVDSLILDTDYYAWRCGGIAMTDNGNPIASFSPSPLLNGQSIVVRGEMKTEGVYETISYNTHIYPNPASGLIHIESIDKSGASIRITDIFGKDILRDKLSDQGKLTLDLTGLAKGVYDILLNHLGKVFSVGKVVLIGK